MHITLIDDSIVFDGYSPSSQPLGGTEKAFASLPGALAARGHEVHVINRSKYQLTIEGAFWRQWESPRPARSDVVIAFRKPELLDLVPADRHILWLASPAGYLGKAAHRAVLERLRPSLVFMSDAHRRTWKGGVDLSETVIAPGVRAEFLADTDTDRDTGADGNLDDPPYAVVTTHPLRGLDELLKIWVERIHPNLPGAVLKIYSKALDRGRLGGAVPDQIHPVFTRASRAGGSGVIIERPKADPGMAEAYRGGRVHLYPGAAADVHCSTLTESQACGMPAVARAGGAIAERIVNGKTGYVVPDTDALVNVTLLLLQDDPTYNSVNREARALQRHRTWAAVAADFEALWR